MVHIGKKIKSIFDKKGLTVSEFGRRINKSRENVYDIFSRKSIDTSLLEKISEVLEYDFFTLYCKSYKQEVLKLKEENKLLKEMNKLLRRSKKSTE